MRPCLLAGGVLAALLLPESAFAEGGLPGGPVAVRAMPATGSMNAAPAGAVAAEEPGGAVFSPFNESPATRVPPHRPVAQAPEPEPPDGLLTIVVAVAGAAVIAWLLRRAL